MITGFALQKNLQNIHHRYCFYNALKSFLYLWNDLWLYQKTAGNVVPRKASEPPADDEVTRRGRIDGANRYWFVSRKSHANLPLRPKTHDSSGAVSQIFFRGLVQTATDYFKNIFRGVSRGRTDFSDARGRMKWEKMEEMDVFLEMDGDVERRVFVCLFV